MSNGPRLVTPADLAAWPIGTRVSVAWGNHRRPGRVVGYSKLRVRVALDDKPHYPKRCVNVDGTVSEWDCTPSPHTLRAL